LSRDSYYIFPEFCTEQIPSKGKMTMEGKRFILGKDSDLSDLRVYTIAKSKIYNPVFSSEGYCRLSPVDS